MEMASAILCTFQPRSFRTNWDLKKIGAVAILYASNRGWGRINPKPPAKSMSEWKHERIADR